jgi:uncharacterized protein YeaO (DUF488 family)
VRAPESDVRPMRQWPRGVRQERTDLWLQDAYQ